MQEEIVSTTEEHAAPSDPTAEVESGATAQEGAGTGGADRDAVVEALKNVYDPELGLNIVDLGLVYEIDVQPDGGIDIQYSLTTMGCPIGPMIEDQMRSFLRGVPGVGEVRPEFVLRPPWTPEMMSDEAKAALGIF
ncbi:MAG TPA: iron-sulfur cluster assembly protein [Actinomycetota bacterium]